MTTATVEALLETMEAKPTRFQEASQLLDLVVARRDHDELVRLAHALRASPAPRSVTAWVGQRLLRSLALGGRMLETLVEVLEGGIEGWGSRFELEDMVAQREDVGELRSALRLRHRDLEFFAGVMQSLVCAGCDLSAVPEALVFRDELIELQHPLGLLPLRRTPLEDLVRRARHSLDGATSEGHHLPKVVERELFPAVVERIEPVSDELEDAVRFWTGREAGRFRLAAPATPIDLRTLPLECLKGRRTTQVMVAPDDLFARFFSAASQGGAYGGGEGGARARLSVFRTMNAFTRDEPLELDATLAAIAQAEWWFFGGSAFFADVAWDLGAACRRADGVTVVVLAATDTD